MLVIFGLVKGSGVVYIAVNKRESATGIKRSERDWSVSFAFVIQSRFDSNVTW